MTRPYGNGMFKISLDQSYRAFDNVYRVDEIRSKVEDKKKLNQPLNKVELEYCNRNDIQVKLNRNNNGWYCL